jgi:hypothetical protein
MVDQKMKEWIDKASIGELLFKWRMAEAGDPHFQGETGDYFVKVMNEKRKTDEDAFTEASKSIGWRK